MTLARPCLRANSKSRSSRPERTHYRPCVGEDEVRDQIGTRLVRERLIATGRCRSPPSQLPLTPRDPATGSDRHARGTPPIGRLRRERSTSACSGAGRTTRRKSCQACREHFDRCLCCARQRLHVRPRAPTIDDPGAASSLFSAIRQPIECVDRFVGVRRDAQEPLISSRIVIRVAAPAPAVRPARSKGRSQSHRG
jgi:hypothetical protein